MFKLSQRFSGDNFPIGDDVKVFGIKFDFDMSIEVRTYTEIKKDLIGALVLLDPEGFCETSEHGQLNTMPNRQPFLIENIPCKLQTCFVHGKHVDYLPDIINSLWDKTLEINVNEEARLLKLIAKTENEDRKAEYAKGLIPVRKAIETLNQGFFAYNIVKYQ